MVARNLIPAGAVGCALSHLEIYKKIAADDADEALILEDDVDLPPDLGSTIDAVAKHLTGAEVALLNYQANDECQLSSRNAVELPGRLLALPINVKPMDSTAGYIITRAASERMIKYAPPVRANADDWHFFYREGILDRIRCVWPQVVIKNSSLDSTMGSYSLSQPGLKASLLGPIVRRNIPLVRHAILYRRERIFRRRNQSVVVDAPFITQPSRIDE
jgi:glycosyl transferase family 25